MACWLWAVPPDNYPVYVKTGTFAIRKMGRAAWATLRPGDRIFAYLSGTQALVGMFEVVGEPFEDTTPLIPGRSYLYRVRVRALVALSEENWIPYAAFHDRLDVVRDYPSFRAVVQQVLHRLPRVDEKVLEFLVRARQASDMEKVFAAYEAYLKAREEPPETTSTVQEERAAYVPAPPFDRPAATDAALRHIASQGFRYEPWQVAAYLTALRTKPFVILAGVSGIGKSKLPALVAAATGGVTRLIPVRPSWADSAEVMGYVDLQGRFRPGAVLQAAAEAQHQPGRHHTCLLDEMNLARVEHYFAEALSRIEDRKPSSGGGFESTPLLEAGLVGTDVQWSRVSLPSNFALVGTVNMDESTHGFSRKVIDRAFTLELAEVDLTARPAASDDPPPVPDPWPVAAWYPRAISIHALTDLDEATQRLLDHILDALTQVNALLTPAQVQFAYRTRDEITLFVLHAAETPDAFRTHDRHPVDPLDLALYMKVLPRLSGGSRPLRRAVLGLLGWAATGAAFSDDDDARAVLDRWRTTGTPLALPDTRFPRTTARLCLMWERLLDEGFTSFWY